MSESGGFLKFSHALTPDNEMLSISFFTQVLCWEYYSKPKNSVVIQFIKYPNFDFINWKKKKKTRKISESGGFLPYDYYEQTNAIQLELF